MAAMAQVPHSQKPFAAIVLAAGLTVLALWGLRAAGVQIAAPAVQLETEAARVLKFEDAPGGVVLVKDAKTGELIQSFGVAQGAFLRATLRALVHDRQHKGVTTDGDFRLERRKGQQLYLIDEATGKTLALNAFGPSNAAVFAAFMSNQKGEGL